MEEVLWYGGMWKRYASLPPIKRGLLLAMAGLIQHFFIAQQVVSTLIRVISTRTSSTLCGYV